VFYFWYNLEKNVTCSNRVKILQITVVHVVYIIVHHYFVYSLLRGSEIASRKLRYFEAICRQQDKSKLQRVFFRSSCRNV
jgi:hypothetical protein